MPVDSVDEEGMPRRENCARNLFPLDLGECGVMRLETWNAKLYGISARYSALSGVLLRRVGIREVLGTRGPYAASPTP